MAITIIQPFVAHYREDFYKLLLQEIDFDLLCIEKPLSDESFKISDQINLEWLPSYKFNRFIFFNIFRKEILKNKIIVTTFNPNWISLYVLLLTKFFIGKKVVLWTHGTSVLNGFNPGSLRDIIKIIFFNLADGICFYTNNELEIMSKYLKRPKLFYINNTINVNKINEISLSIKDDKSSLKKKYGILSSKVVIFCARFIEHRREDILVDLIKTLENKDVSFIIIGNGIKKPDFNSFSKVHDFGAVYDSQLKAELFKIADFNFQPAWSGLSVIESLANGVPYLTMKKSKDIYQCVEYNYIENYKNGFIFDNINDAAELICNIKSEELSNIKLYCKECVNKKLTIEKMVKKFYDGINTIN
jgi:hypothetical protein